MVLNVDKILSNPKITRTNLSIIYKELKKLNLGIPWLDLLRKTTRNELLNKLKNKLEPKPQKYIVSGKIKITVRSNFEGKNGATERITTSEEKYNETITATSKEEAIKKQLISVVYKSSFKGKKKLTS